MPLSPYQNRRWDSDFLTVRALAADGTLGELTRFESRFERLDPDPGPPAAGGGTLRDFGSHLVDQALVLLGPVDSVYAEWRITAAGWTTTSSWRSPTPAAPARTCGAAGARAPPARGSG